MALGMSLGPVVGQNWGAKNYGRILTAAKYGAKFAVGWGIFIWIIMRFLSKPLAYVFDQNEIVINIVGVYFLIVAWAYGFRGTLRISTTILSIINKPIDAALLNFSQSILLLIPLGYLGKHLFGIEGIFGALVLSQLLAGGFAYNWLKRVIQKVMNMPDTGH
jgi:Na+-driven multidrug efflux pump